MSKEITLGFDKMLKDLDITKEQLNAITNYGKTIEFKSDFYYKKKIKHTRLRSFCFK